MNSPSKYLSLSPRTIRLLYAATLLLYLVASFLPQYRVWGIGVWAHLPMTSVFVLFTVGAVVLAIEIMASSRPSFERLATNGLSDKTYLLIYLSITVLFAATAYLLRVEVHFLGDGYQVLSVLSSPVPFVKLRDIGSMGLQYAALQMIGSRSDSAALLAYQSVSWFAGILYVVTVFVAAQRLFSNNLARLQMAMIFLSCGSLVLFFGYVENYALATVLILLFTLVSILALLGKLSRWWVVPISFGAIFFHVLCAALFPALLYVLFRETVFGKKLARATRHIKVLLTFVVAAGLGVVFIYLYSTNYNFRLTFVPLIPTATTVDSYSLFSWKHVADIVNLLFLLAPAVLIYGLLIWRRLKDRSTLDRSERLLALASLTFAGVFFVLDPRLGMPRDWDLFSLNCVPLVAFGGWILLNKVEPAVRLSTTILITGLGLLSIFPRAIVLHLPERGMAQIENYMSLDPGRSRAGLTTLSECFMKRGDTVSVTRIRNLTNERFPGVPMIYTAKALADQGKYGEAKSWTSGAIRLNPTFADAWLLLSQCLVVERDYDSALIAAEISDGLNPYNPSTREQLAMLHFMGKRYDEAFDVWTDLSQRDTSWANPLYGIACVYRARGDMEKYREFLVKACEKKSALPQFWVELADLHFLAGQMQRGAIALQQARARGVDPDLVNERVARYPQISGWLGP